MPVPVMRVRHVRVVVHEGAVTVRMGVRLGRGDLGAVFVPMMLVVHVDVVVLQRLVRVMV